MVDNNQAGFFIYTNTNLEGIHNLTLSLENLPNGSYQLYYIYNDNINIDILMIGDSFTEGACVGRKNDIGAKLRNLNYNVLIYWLSEPLANATLLITQTGGVEDTYSPQRIELIGKELGKGSFEELNFRNKLKLNV